MIKRNHQSLLNSVESEKPLQIIRVSGHRPLIVSERQSYSTRQNSSPKRTGVLPIKLKQELEAGKLKIQSYEEYIVKQIHKQK